jgi:uridine kinase
MRIGVDGLMGSGKTMFADALARRMAATRLSIDDFHRPAGQRVDYYTDAFDLPAFRAAVEAAAGTVVADGIFLHKPELRGAFDLTIWLAVDRDVARARAIERDSPWMEDAAERYATRYAPAETRYLDEIDPERLADIVVDTTDPAHPRLVLDSLS